MPLDRGELGSTELALVYEVSRVVSSGLTLEQMLDSMIRLASDVTRCDACLVYLPDPDTGDVVLRASQLPHNDEIGHVRMKMGEGVTGWVAEHRSPVALSHDAASDPRFKGFSTLVEDSYQAFLSVPLISGGVVIGVINVHHKKPHEHGEQEIALLAFLGEQMGGAIAKARLAGQSQKLQEEAIEVKRELEVRKLVERAKGILQRQYGLTEEEAYHRLRNDSRRSRRPMREVAEAVILTERLGRSAN